MPETKRAFCAGTNRTMCRQQESSVLRALATGFAGGGEITSP